MLSLSFQLVVLICAFERAFVTNALSTFNTHCPSAKLSPALPPNQTVLSIPIGETDAFVTLGRGVQNYTCSTALAWTSVGAVASLFDVSCLPSSAYPTLPSLALAIPTKIRRATTTTFSTAGLLDAVSSHRSNPSCVVPGYLGQHYFVLFNNTLSPKFDFTQTQHSTSAYFIGTKVGSLPSPTNSTVDVAWLELKAVDGSLGKTVFRLNTAGGQPPTSCTTPGANLSVQYAAVYWIFR